MTARAQPRPKPILWIDRFRPRNAAGIESKMKGMVFDGLREGGRILHESAVPHLSHKPYTTNS